MKKNTFKVEIRPTDILSVADEVIPAIIDQANSKQQVFIFHKPEKALFVMADKFRINQVLNNLLTNAVLYTKNGGTITLTIAEQEHDVVCKVTDTGHGIPADAIPKLFTKFFRVSGPLEQGSKGTGVGLFIAKSIITLHKGKIWVESEYDKGSTFYFTLPKAAPDQVADAKLQLSLQQSDVHRAILNPDRQA